MLWTIFGHYFYSGICVRESSRVRVSTALGDNPGTPYAAEFTAPFPFQYGI